MKNNFKYFLRNLAGLKLLAAIGFCIILPIIIFYQLIISLFIPTFYNVMILLIQYIIFLCLIFWTLFF